MPSDLPSIYQQFGAVLAAPIPFFIALAIIVWAAWRAWQWRYKAAFEKQTELYTLSRQEVEHWKNLAELTTKNATQQLERLDALISKQEEITAHTKKLVGDEMAELKSDTKKQVEDLSGTFKQLSVQLNALGQANNSTVAVTGSLAAPLARFGVVPHATSTSEGIAGPSGMDWTSEGWKPRKS
jgi:hypothetical protein